MNHPGMVYLVGAGPGDVGLLTLRGAEVLGRARVVLHDGLVNPDLLRWAAPGAEIIYGGKHDQTRAVSQEQLNSLLIAKAREGKCVVRLKGGDPYVFARGGEEAMHLVEAGIPFEVVPGVSSVEAGPNYAGIPLTHRDFCSSYTVITGHEDPARAESRLNWKALGELTGTLVILMGLKQLERITGLLQANGRSGNTPAALIRWATTSRQEVIEGTLATIAAKAAEARLCPPVITIIGDVVKLRSELDWFGRRPLMGQRVVVTLSRELSPELCGLLRERGAEVLEVPGMKCTPPPDSRRVQETMSRLNTYDWILFSNQVSVAFFFQQFFQQHRDWRDLGNARIGAFGPLTAIELEKLRLRVDAIPSDHQGPPILDALAPLGGVAGRRILLARPQIAGAGIPQCLREAGAHVDDLPVYESVVEDEDPQGAAARFADSGADWLTFAGYFDMDYFHHRFNIHELRKKFPRLRIATIGPKTARLVNDLGLKVDAAAVSSTMESLVEAIEKAGPV
jgi:uroporphyrinogen III methyltransferase/synthase